MTCSEVKLVSLGLLGESGRCEWLPLMVLGESHTVLQWCPTNPASLLALPGEGAVTWCIETVTVSGSTCKLVVFLSSSIWHTRASPWQLIHVSVHMGAISLSCRQRAGTNSWPNQNRTVTWYQILCLSCEDAHYKCSTCPSVRQIEFFVVYNVYKDLKWSWCPHKPQQQKRTCLRHHPVQHLKPVCVSWQRGVVSFYQPWYLGQRQWRG